MPGPTTKHHQDLQTGVVKELAQRLGNDPALRLPQSVVRDVPAEGAAAAATRARQYLEHLLRNDPAIFLERHGALLTAADVASFSELRGDYEVNFHLESIERRLGPTTRAQEVQRKNRRLAYMARLEATGDYFTMSEMRGRCPQLHEQLLGAFAAQSAAAARLHSCPRTGGVNSEMVDCLLEAAEERRVSARLARLNEAEAQVEYETDSDEEEDKRMEAVRDGAAGGGREGGEGEAEGEGPPPDLPPEEMVELEAEFTRLMKERFLGGRDEGIDYDAIDNNADLDTDLMREINQDHEDAYFDAD